MAKSTKMGMNRTGAQMAPMKVKQMEQWADLAAADAAEGAERLAAIRNDYIAEADRIGSVPLPGTVKGAAKAGAKKLIGKHPEVLIDKLGERLAFERTGTRLYEALMQRARADMKGSFRLPLDELQTFYEQEVEHYALVKAAIESLGADPTAQTPCADSAAVASMGIVQVLSDPRSTIPQCLNALLSAELIDNAGWELLIDLAREVGQDDMADTFEDALAQESVHMETVQLWLSKAVLSEAG